VADIDSDITPDNSIEDSESPKQWDVSSASNGAGLIRPTQKSKRLADWLIVTINATETKTNTGVKKMYNTMFQYFTSFLVYLDGEL